MLSPHESLNLNAKRGLLAAVNGNPATYPGCVSIYDVTHDCRHPVLDFDRAASRASATRAASRPTARPSTRPAPRYQSITAIDVTDPKAPHAIWQGNVLSHGMSLSDDGNRAYIADPTGGDMLILDTSEIQARKPNPQASEISRTDLGPRVDPAERDPVHRERPPLRARVRRVQRRARWARGERRRRRRRRGSSTSPTRRTPQVVSNLRLQVNQPADHEAATAATPARGRAGGARATRRTTATSRRASTRRSWRARSSPRACGCSTSAT